MTQPKNQISCPRCGLEIDVNDILYHQLQEELSKDYNSKLAGRQKEFDQKMAEIRRQQEQVMEDKKNLSDMIEKGIREKISSEKIIVEKKIREQVAQEKSDEIKSYQEQLALKVAEAKELNKTRAELARMQREKEELQGKLEAEMEIKYSEALNEEKKKIGDIVEEKNRLKIAEKELIIKQLSEQLEIAKRKADQGSTQLQGEVQELAIEEFLRNSFPFDEIIEIKKGQRGADCLQIVHTRTSQDCGSIYYESKRTKDFQKTWIEKFKEDMRVKKATFGVLVTDVMPEEMDRMGQKEGVWVCTFSEFKGLCHVLREAIIMLKNASSAMENRGEKMSMLYQYLTGPEFRMQIEAIVEGFTQMQADLIKERNAMEGIWKKREKQIEKVLLNSTHMYASIKGIAGKSMGEIEGLALPEPAEEQDLIK